MARTLEDVDAVKLMRSIRDRLSEDFAGLSFVDQRRLIDAELRTRKPPNKRIQPPRSDTRATGRSHRARG
jgi:hypothetical protein